MANGRSVAPVRKVLAGVVGTIAVFVIFYGAGRASWATVAIGGALLILAISLIAVSALRGGARDWVAGSAHVVSASEPPANSTYGRCELQILIDAPGLPAAAVKIRDPRVPVSKWPDAGATLPIMVALNDPRHVRIQWDDVLTHAEAAAEEEFEEYERVGSEPVTEDLSGPMHEAEDRIVRADGGGGTGTLDLADEAELIRDEERARDEPDREPVIITQTPAGDVIEGRVVEASRSKTGAEHPGRDAGGAAAGGAARDPGGVPRPRRKPSPRPRREEQASHTTTATAPTATAATSAAATAAATAATSAATAAAQEGAENGDDLDDLITAYPSARPGPTGSIHGVGITVLVTDLERSIAFYRDMLGFFEIDGGDGNAVLASGDTRLVLREIPDVTPVNRRVVHLNLEVGDVEATYSELKAKGVRFTYAPRPVNKGERLELWAAAFRDPDGHGIAITQWRSRPSG